MDQTDKQRALKLRRQKRKARQTAAMAQRGLVPQDVRHSAIQSLAAHGKIRMLPESVMLRARHMFVTKGMPVRPIARELEIEPATIERWAHIFNWHDLKAKRDMHQYQRVMGIRRNFTPNIDEKQDRIFSSIENLLEDTIRTIQNSDETPSAKQLKDLASVAKSCQDGRRVIQGKETGINKQVKEVTGNPDLLESIVGTLTELAKGSSPTKRLSIMDAEYEELDEAS
jgi:hypothetical protein